LGDPQVKHGRAAFIVRTLQHVMDDPRTFGVQPRLLDS